MPASLRSRFETLAGHGDTPLSVRQGHSRCAPSLRLPLTGSTSDNWLLWERCFNRSPIL
jgi:hypothetical protein